MALLALTLGVLGWWVVHSFPLLYPQKRDAWKAEIGETRYKALFSIATLVCITFMIFGYREAPFDLAYVPPAWGQHANNALMILAMFLVGASHSKGSARHYLRNPLFYAVIIWAIAHLLVRGWVESVILFGGLGLWAIAAIFMQNRRDGAWQRPAKGPLKKDIILLISTPVAYGIFAAIHVAFGLAPLPM